MMIKALFQRTIYDETTDTLVAHTETLVEFESVVDLSRAVGVYSNDVAKTHQRQGRYKHYFEVLRLI